MAKRLQFFARNLNTAYEHSKGRRAPDLIDLGCGTGTYVTLPLAALGYQIIGLDIDGPSLIRARENATLVDANPVGWIQGEPYCIASGAVDVVIAAEVIEHQADPLGLLSQIHRILTPGGLLLASVPNGYGYFELESQLQRLLPSIAGLLDNWERALVRRLGPEWLVRRHMEEYGGLDPKADRRRNRLEQSTLAQGTRHQQRFTVGKLERSLQEAGFELIELRGNTLLAGNLLQVITRSLDWVISANAWLGGVVPLIFASDWLLAARKRE